MIEIEKYVQDTTKCVFIFDSENYVEGKGFGLTIQCGISGKRSVVQSEQTGDQLFLPDEKTTRSAIAKMNKRIGILSAESELEIRSMSLQPLEE